MAVLRGAPLDRPEAELAVTVLRTEGTVTRVAICW